MRPLATVAREVKAGTATAAELLDAFVRSRVYLPRPPTPGVVTVALGDRRVVPVFSSEQELARFAGRTDWFSTDGLDLLGLVPAGVVLGLDMASPHRLQLDPAAVRLDHALYLPGRNRRRPGDAASDEAHRPGPATSGREPPR